MSNDHIRTASDKFFIESGGLYCPEYGDRVLSFLTKYVRTPHGQPFVLMPWIEDVIHSIYSWRNPDLSRRTQVCILSIGRQNGKSFVVGGLHAFTILTQPGARTLNVATNQSQAAQIFDYVVASKRHNIDHGDGKLACLRDVKSKNEVHYDVGNSSFLSAPSNSKSLYGRPLDLVTLDEMAHYVNDSENLWRALKDSTVATGGLKVIISSAGFNTNSQFYRMVQDCRKILSGEIIDTTIQPWIFESTGDYEDPANWSDANPSLGTVQTEEQFKLDWETAKRDPNEKFNFIRLRMNCWTATSEATWIPVEDWERCEGEFPDFSKTYHEAHIGIDWGHSQDLAGLVLAIKCDQKTYIRTWGWVPEKATDREKQNIGIYRLLSSQGDLNIVKGDANAIEGDLMPTLNRLLASYNVRTITIDKWQLMQVAEGLMGRGYKVFEMSPYPTQTNAPVNEILRAVSDGTLVHDGSPLLRWQIGHAILERNARGYCSITKAFPHQKIDNLDAMIMAWSQVMQTQVEIEHPYANSQVGSYRMW